MTQKLKITLKKSTIGSQKGKIATVKGLGLKKINSSVIREATPETLGMIKKIKHLVITENN
jgi:large subunit ribosomal protein L30